MEGDRAHSQATKSGGSLLPPCNDLLDVGGQEESEKLADGSAPALYRTASLGRSTKRGTMTRCYVRLGRACDTSGYGSVDAFPAKAVDQVLHGSSAYRINLLASLL